MSSARLYRIYRTTTNVLAEYPVGRGVERPLLNYLRAQFLNRKYSALEPAREDLFLLAFDERVPLCLRLCHAWTRQTIACPVARVAEFADAAQEVAEIVAHEPVLSHWASIAADLRAHRPGANQRGVGLGAHRADDPWEGWKGTAQAYDLFGYVNLQVPPLPDSPSHTA
jgi:hypothetical protein